MIWPLVWLFVWLALGSPVTDWALGTAVVSLYMAAWSLFQSPTLVIQAVEAPKENTDG